jgi:hypothetical protein
MGLVSTVGRGAGKWSLWGRIMVVAEVALIAKRHLDKLGPGEVGELRDLLVKSKGRPGNLSSRERSRIKELVTKLEPGAFAKSAATSSVPHSRKR